ncbi:MAG TPA: type II toxin-antitoxin system VapB family antitoxin [Propionibacteriaceae bacterium]|nr:type II toxin-antitoxin system VapB family antitoxin [Propionibacteriaceae bacterium]HPZ49869.1 type II toxin-antitoxin system VapB family antitoxin [Propionibacteriaceae bacterium]HQE30983.1 type II toxin-antitoxin system VapB family antitoxin [Propionibacteriaceae bacterium]
MRTTITIDDDVLQAAQELARLQRTTAGSVISDLARRGLAAPGTGASPTSTTRNGFALFASRGAAVTDAVVDRIREEEQV